MITLKKVQALKSPGAVVCDGTRLIQTVGRLYPQINGCGNGPVTCQCCGKSCRQDEPMAHADHCVANLVIAEQSKISAAMATDGDEHAGLVEGAEFLLSELSALDRRLLFRKYCQRCGDANLECACLPDD